MSFLLEPLSAYLIKISSQEPFDSLGPLTLFVTITSAFGIWLVVRRYHAMRNRAIYFSWAAPAASFPDYTSVTISNPSLTSHENDPSLLPIDHTPDSPRKYITCYDPATGLYIGTVPADTAEEITDKITLAKDAQESWKMTTFTQRKQVLRSIQAWLIRDMETCAQVACRDTGKTMLDAAFGEIITTCSKIDWTVQHGEEALRPSKRHNNFLMFYKSSHVYYEPLGVVTAIVSWNYPLHNALSPIIASIFAGNAVVLKCSEYVAWSSKYFVGAVRKALGVCGMDPEIIQLVVCYPEEAEALTKSPDIKHITFIGSEPVGRKVAMAATHHLTPVTLELGGKDPVIVLPGTDISKFSSTWMRGVFQAMGQNCIGLERFIVHSSLYDAFIAEMESRIPKMRMGSVLAESDEGFISTVDSGSMISRTRFDELERMIDDAVNEGADLVVGGRRYQHPYFSEGSYFSPTLLGNVSDTMDIAREEVFAPVMLVMKYDHTEEAIQIANGTRYGLGASVFGPIQHRCVEVAKQLECGMVAINDFGVFYLNQDLPFGGTKSSGYGRFSGPEGLRALTSTKAIITDKWPWLIQTVIPRAVDYPVQNLASSWEFISGLIAFVYADSLRRRLEGLGKMIRST